MSASPTVQFFLEAGLRKSAEAREHNFLRILTEVLEDAGLDVVFRANSLADRLRFSAASQLSLTHMKDPVTDQGLTFRRVYHYPFWQIEQVAERWNWDVALTDFTPDQVDEKPARAFFERWKNRLYSSAKSEKAGYVYVPLQGRIQDHRSFQGCSPVEMLACVLDKIEQPVVVTLHPKETYTQQDIKAVEKLVSKRSDVTLETGNMETHLARCDFVVTENSSAAFNAMFFEKPSILFADIDFHHIAIKASPDTFKTALSDIPDHRPDYARYIYWFWQMNALNAGRPDVKDHIRARLVRFGWPIG